MTRVRLHDADDPARVLDDALATWFDAAHSPTGEDLLELSLHGGSYVSGQVLAQPGHKVADLATQIAAVQGAALNENDLALVMVGMNDILELYGDYPTTSRDSLLALARDRGEALGERINALARSGPAVVVLTVPDLGLTPFARAQNTSTGDATRSRLLSDLSSAFNNRMSVTLINDGRLIGLVYADVELQTMARLPGFYNLTNVVDASCLGTATTKRSSWP